MNINISNSALTALKLLGITAMVIDHYNSYIKPEYNQLLFEIGRLALPLFVFVLGYNLTRITRKTMRKTMLRLLVFGVIATPIYNILGNSLWSWWPLNILFTLLVATTTIYLLSVPLSSRFIVPVRLAAVIFFIVTGSMVDYIWVGPALVVATWCLFKEFSRVSNPERVFVYVVLAMLAALLCMLNSSLSALLALPIILVVVFLFQHDALPIPRMKWFFYWFYPGHLLALLLIKSA